jgi:hypothetical protein
MNLEKREALEQTYKAAIQIGWFDGSLDAIAEYFVEDFSLYGTGYNEKTLSGSFPADLQTEGDAWLLEEM